MGRSRDKLIRVAFFDEAVAFGGSVVVLSNLLQHIDRTRFDPLVVTSLDEQSIDQLFRPSDILVRFRPKLDYSDRIRWMAKLAITTPQLKRIGAYCFSTIAFISNLPAHLQLYFKIWRAKPDLIHLNNGREALIAARLLRIPLLVHLHGFAPEMLTGRHGQIAHARLFISISKYISDQVLATGVNRDRLLDIANPAPDRRPRIISRRQWQERYSLPERSVVFAHVARLIRWKGQLEFLEAFALVSHQLPEAYALIVGDDVEGFSHEYPRQLREFVLSRGIGGKVVFAGHVSEVLELMAFSDVVVHSSIDPEPFGLVITEAMTAGTAIIAARLGAPIELIVDGKTGLLVDPKNTTEFASAIARLATNEDLRHKLGAAAREDARERFSPDAFARRMEDAYLKAMQPEAKGRVN